MKSIPAFGFTLLLVLTLSQCKIGKSGPDIPEEELAGLSKPAIRSINPGGIIFSDSGFYLDVDSDYYENDEYVLYINGRKMEAQRPNYWRYRLTWKITREFLNSLVDPESTTDSYLELRLTSIVHYDIADYFDRYAAYVSGLHLFTVKPRGSGFSEPVRLFQEWNLSAAPVLKTDDRGTLGLAWIETLNGTGQAFFCYSRDGGTTWSQVLNISRSTRPVFHLDLAMAANGRFYLVWCERSEGSGVVKFCRSLDQGATWLDPRQLTASEQAADRPAMVVDSRGNIYVAWCEGEPENYWQYQHIWVNISIDDGMTWEKKPVRSGDFLGGDPALSADERGNVYVIADSGNGILCLYSGNGGFNWQESLNQTVASFTWARFSALVTGTPGQLFLIWYTADTVGHNNNHWIHFCRGINHGAQWADYQYIDNICNTSGGQAAMAALGEQLKIVVDTRESLCLIKSAAGGHSWSFPEFIPGTEGSTTPAMALAADGTIYLVYVNNDDPDAQLNGLCFTTSR